MVLELIDKVAQGTADRRETGLPHRAVDGGLWDVGPGGPQAGLFAAIAPVCGGADEATAPKIKDLPIWAFHGAKDTAVKPERSRNMIAALKKAGGKPKYTEYPTSVTTPGTTPTRTRSSTSGCSARRRSKYLCGIGRSADSAGRSARSATACGAWPAGPAATTTKRASRLQLAVELGCNFFDTALAYGEGHQRRLCSANSSATNPGQRLYRRDQDPAEEPDVAVAAAASGSTTSSRPTTSARRPRRASKNLGLPPLDLMQFHVWEDAWAADERWQQAVDDLKGEGLVKAFGISVNRWEPTNVIATLRTGLIDAVQVIYNVFDQNPEDELFPVCRELGVAVIARVPFDEGSADRHADDGHASWPEGDWRNTYFVPENLVAERRAGRRLKPLVPAGSTMAEMALRFILSNPDVATVIPGMRKERNVRANLGSSDAGPLPARAVERVEGASLGPHADGVVAVTGAACGFAVRPAEVPTSNATGFRRSRTGGQFGGSRSERELEPEVEAVQVEVRVVQQVPPPQDDAFPNVGEVGTWVRSRFGGVVMASGRTTRLMYRKLYPTLIRHRLVRLSRG